MITNRKIEASPDIAVLCRFLDFPEEAAAALTGAEKKLSSHPELLAALAEAVELLFAGEGDEYRFPLDEIGRKIRMDRKTLDLLFLLHALPVLKEKYDTAGISEKIFRDTAADLRCKMIECHDCYGVWGTAATSWQTGFFRMTRFALGRLQYERIPFPFDAYGPLKKGDTVYACHIPSTTPLTRESVDESLSCAYRFFEPELSGGALPVYTCSWILYPENKAFMAENSNLMQFSKRFDILRAEPDPRNGDLWRIFNRFYDPSTVNDLPENTSLRRALKRYLQNGGCMGTGWGMLLFKLQNKE